MEFYSYTILCCIVVLLNVKLHKKKFGNINKTSSTVIKYDFCVFFAAANLFVWTKKLLGIKTFYLLFKNVFHVSTT